MTATIVPWVAKLQTSSTEDISHSQSLSPQTNAFISTEDFGVRQLRSVGFSSTNLENYLVENNSNAGPLPVERIYPHVFDETIEAGQALAYIRSAIIDARKAVDAFGEPDLQEVGTRLTQISVAMGKAHALTDFNESLGALISFIRRATLAAITSEVSRSELNTLVNVLALVAANPMIDLDEASDMVDQLSGEGWRGELRLADEIIRALLEDTNLAPEEVQALLFPEPQVAE